MESELYKLGEFPTLDAAFDASKKIVDEYLLSAYHPGMTSQALFAGYTSFGDDPYIVATPSNDAEVLFSAWDYAKRRCDELCTPIQDLDDDG